MNTDEPHDSMPHSEPASTTDAGTAERAGRRFLDEDVPVADPAATPTVATTPEPQPTSTVPDFAPPVYVASNAAPTGYLPPASAPVPAALSSEVPPPPPPPAPQPVVPLHATSGTERVGRGVLFSLGGVVLGIVATVVLWQLNFIAAITSLLMAWACIWLYTKGAGQPPRKGVFAVVAVIALGVVLALVSAIASDAVVYANEYFAQPSIADYRDTIVVVLSTPEVWSEYATSIGMYVLFAALGTVGIIMQLARGKQTP